MRSTRWFIPLAVATLACTGTQLEPVVDADAGTDRVAAAPVPNAAVYWNEIARGLLVRYNGNPYQAARGYALVSIAQYNAAVMAADGRTEGHPSERAAITRASVDVLKYLYPAEGEALERSAAQFLDTDARPDRDARLGLPGDRAGRIAAARIIERAMNDRFFQPWTGIVPAGPGLWFSSANPPAPPILPLLGKALPFLLRSGAQFRPAPPPAFGSDAFDAALAEVRSIADSRTRDQDSIAKFWAFPAGTYAPPGYWNDEASRLAVASGLATRSTAHLLALMNMAGADALIAGHDAKYAYWLIRPSQADPAIKLAIGLPNFPSYFSNHAAVSAAMARIIGKWFPAEATRLDLRADEAALSRLYGGIHFRFDNETGLLVGRRIAAWALEHDVPDGRPFTLRPAS